MQFPWQPKAAIENILRSADDIPADIRKRYAERLAQGALTRDENPTSHFCAYFFPYRASERKVFLVAHKKSGLWLSPGGHIDPGEIPAVTVAREMKEELNIDYSHQDVPSPRLLTITDIKQDVRPCKEHFDLWYFIPMDEVSLPTHKEGEFDDARWFTVEEAKKIVTDESNLKAISFLERRIFKMKVYFAAHATTKDNEDKIASGWNDPELSDKGIEQAKQLGDVFKNIKLDLVCCSDLRRAADTVRLAFGEKYPIITDRRLRELNYGKYNGQPSVIVEPTKPRHIKIPFPEGESYDIAIKRVMEFYKDLKENHPSETALVVGHRATQYGLAVLTGKNWIEQLGKPFKWQPYWEYEI